MALLSSCQPMQYDDLSESGYLSIDRETYEITAEDDGTTVKIKFKAITNAKSYGYAVSGGDISQLTSNQLTFDSGYYIATISRDQIFSTEGEETHKSKSSAKSSNINPNVTLYASTKSTASDWIVVKSVEVEISIENVAPQLYETSRDEDLVIIAARNEAVAGSMEYKIEYGSSNSSVTFSSSDLPYTLKGIGNAAQEIKVSHKISGGEAYGALTQALSVSEYDPRQTKMDITENNGDITVVSNAPASYTKIGLFIKPQNEYHLITEQAYSETTVFEKSVFGDGFYAGKLYVGIYKQSIDEESALLSQPFEYDQVIALDDSSTTRKSFSAFIPVSEKLGITASNINVNGLGVTPAITETENGFNISLADLESARTYSGTIDITIPGYKVVSQPLSITTNSFEGVYTWDCSVEGRTFVVNAILNPSYPYSSQYKYKITINKNDPKFDGTEHQIMPLVEGTVEGAIDYNSGLVDDTFNYITENDAYKWNYNKWKEEKGLASLAVIKKWTP